MNDIQADELGANSRSGARDTLRATALNSWDSYLSWLIGNALLTIVVAWIAFQAQQEQIAPAVLFPLFVGACLGAGGRLILRVSRMSNTRLALAGAVAWGLLVVIGQDYIGHSHRVRLYADELDRQSPLAAVVVGQQPQMRPHFWPYLASVVRGEPVWWSLEAVLTCGAAAAVTVMRRPDARSTPSASEA